MFKSGNALQAADQAAIDAMRKIPEGAHLTVKVSIPRSLRQHRLLFALLNVVCDAQPEPKVFLRPENLLEAIKLATGHVRETKDIKGKSYIVPDSISFARLDQAAFTQFFDAAIRVILENVLPNVQKSDLEREVYGMLNEPMP
jgi:hypothetical protein